MTSRCDHTRAVHLFGHNNVNGTWCQGHNECYWLTAEQVFTWFYTNTMSHDRFDRLLHIFRSLYFNDNINQPDKNDNHHRLWKKRNLFDQLNNAYTKFYSLSVHLAMDEVTMFFKGRESHFQTIYSKKI